jgi:hypothetical protein
MKHTEGKIIQGYSTILERRELISEHGSTIFYGPHMDAGEECKANFDRSEALWNAAKGMTTEEAVARLNYQPSSEVIRYIEHGREMVEDLKNHCEECRVHIKEAKAELNNCPSCPTNDILIKLEAK